MKLRHLLFVPVLLLASCQGKEESTSYKVIYDANGGSFDSGTTIEFTVPANEPIAEIEEIPNHGKDYLFYRWYENKECAGDAFNFETPITHDTTLYAKWLDNSGVDSDYDGLADSIDPAPNDNTYTAHLIEIYPPIHIVDMPVTVDYTRFLSDETVFNKDLEKLGNVCAMDIYLESTTTLKGPSNLYEPLVGNDDEELYMQLGCADIENYTFNPNDYAIDKFDTYRCILAHHYFTKDNQNYEVLFITNQGTDSEAEWYSDFDIGIDNDDYAHVTGVTKGEHQDWENSDIKGDAIHHKGFDVATNRQYKDVIKPYIDKYINKNAKLIIFNTGHSRGAAIANLLGKKFNDKKSELNIYKSFTYTYATPTTVYNNSTNQNISCAGVFNILNGDDLVPQLPLQKWNYYRYGEDISYAVSDNHEEEWQTFNDTLTSYGYPDKGLTDSMYEMATTRESVYSSHTGKIMTKFYSESFITESKRQDKIDQWVDKAKFWYGERTIDFVTTGTVSYKLECYNRPVSLMTRLSVVLGSINEINPTRLLEMLGDGCLCSYYKLIEMEFFENGANLLTAHRGTTYYFISAKLIK